jgi:hypothetical protein
MDFVRVGCVCVCVCAQRSDLVRCVHLCGASRNLEVGNECPSKHGQNHLGSIHVFECECACQRLQLGLNQNHPHTNLKVYACSQLLNM